MKKWIVALLMVMILAACGAEDESNSVDDLLAEEAKVFIQQLENGEFEEAANNFAEEMLEAVPSDQLENIWTELTTQLGELISYEYENTQTQDGYEVVILAAEFETTAAKLLVSFNEAEEIAGFFVQ